MADVGSVEQDAISSNVRLVSDIHIIPNLRSRANAGMWPYFAPLANSDVIADKGLIVKCYAFSDVGKAANFYCLSDIATVPDIA